MQVSEFYDFFAIEIQGGCTEDFMSMIDGLLEEEIITEEFFRKNETEICAIFDSGFFTCSGCGWTMPISEMSIYSDNWECTDCCDEDEL